jgi:hypothetical protein
MENDILNIRSPNYKNPISLQIKSTQIEYKNKHYTIVDDDGLESFKLLFGLNEIFINSKYGGITCPMNNDVVSFFEKH